MIYIISLHNKSGLYVVPLTTDLEICKVCPQLTISLPQRSKGFFFPNVFSYLKFRFVSLSTQVRVTVCLSIFGKNHNKIIVVMLFG